MPQGLDNFIGAVGDAIKTAPTFYEDALQPTVQETGKILALIPQTIEAALLPLRQWNIEREYKFAETKKLLEHKLQNVEPEKIVTPEAYVAVPAIQAISYSMDSEELRNLYANLLAKAMNSDTKDSVHPSFVDMIKQMSPLDAKIFNWIYSRNNCSFAIPIVDLVSYSDRKNHDIFTILETNISGLTFSNHILQSSSFDTLQRLGLVLITDSIHLANKHGYYEVTSSDEYKFLKGKYNNPNLKMNQKTLISTSIGQLFYKICSQN